MLQSASRGGAWSRGDVCSRGCLVWGGVCSQGGCLVWGEGLGVVGCLVWRGCLLPGGCVSGPGGYPSMHWGRHPSPPVDRHTLVKTLPWPNFVAAGNNYEHTLRTFLRSTRVSPAMRKRWGLFLPLNTWWIYVISIHDILSGLDVQPSAVMTNKALIHCNVPIKNADPCNERR